MKKILYLAISVLLVIACQKAENILNIDADVPQGTGAGNLAQVQSISPANGQQLTDNDASQGGIQGKIEVIFEDFMDESTMIPGNLVILNTGNGSEISTDDITTEYYSEIRKLFIFVDNVPDSSAFMIRLLSDMENVYGSPLDFDGDNMIDGSPYDDYHSTFWTQGNTSGLVAFAQPLVVACTPDSSADTILRPYIMVSFNPGVDTLTLTTSNITLENESGSAQSLELVGPRLPTQVMLQPSSNLSFSENYTIIINCDNIVRSGTANTPDYFLKVDGERDGPEETEPELTCFFRVDDPDNPPVVNNVSYYAGYATIEFSMLMDETTLTLENIKILDNSGSVAGELRIYPNIAGDETWVDFVYERTVSGPSAFVSRNVTATNDYQLDGNGNGIGGEPWDDWWD